MFNGSGGTTGTVGGSFLGRGSGKGNGLGDGLGRAHICAPVRFVCARGDPASEQDSEEGWALDWIEYACIAACFSGMVSLPNFGVRPSANRSPFRAKAM